MKKIKNKIYVTAIMLFTVALLITSLDIIVMNRKFYQKQYAKLNTYETMGMSEDDLVRATDKLLDYLKGHTDNLDLTVTVNSKEVEMFNEREKEHMIDVQNLYMGALMVRDVFIIITAIVALIALGLFDWFNFQQSIDNVKSALMILGSLFTVLTLYIVIDFTSFWTQFHEVFFTNDLWLLDPSTDRMIQMFPEPFFNALVQRVLIAFVVIFVFEILSIFVMREIEKVMERRKPI